LGWSKEEQERQDVFAVPPVDPILLLEQGSDLADGSVYLKVLLDGKLSVRFRQIRGILEKQLPNERYRNYRHAKTIMDNILSGKFPVLVK
jgi:hypothetical protein